MPNQVVETINYSACPLSTHLFHKYYADALPFVSVVFCLYEIIATNTDGTIIESQSMKNRSTLIYNEDSIDQFH